MTDKKTLSNSSSRAGRFKKKLVGPEALQDEAPILHRRISLLKSWLLEGRLTDQEFVGLSIIGTLSHRFPGTWLGAKIPVALAPSRLLFPISALPWDLEPNVKKRLESFRTLGEVLAQFSLRSTPLSVNRTLLAWGNGAYRLRLFFHIPRPEEVLAQQVNGERCVTVLTEEKSISHYVLGERDHLGFTLHDLIHADHFFKDNDHYQGQMDFYRLLGLGMQTGAFEEALKQEEFEREFEYLISDMNAYPIHLMKCLKAALVHYSPEGEDYFSEWMKRSPFTERMHVALQVLNTENYQAERYDGIILEELRKIEG